MQVKVIKKDASVTRKKDPAALDFKIGNGSFNNLEEKVEHNISNWICEFREKRNLELSQTNSFLQNLIR